MWFHSKDSMMLLFGESFGIIDARGFKPTLSILDNEASPTFLATFIKHKILY